MKNQYRVGGIAYKGGAWKVCRFKEGLNKKEGVVFSRGGGSIWFHTFSQSSDIFFLVFYKRNTKYLVMKTKMIQQYK